jgi:hypothetical protein
MNRSELQKRGEKFDRAHPEIYAMLLAELEARYERGFRRASLRDLWGKIRWDTARAPIAKDAQGYELNNDLVAYFARRIRHEHPSLGLMLGLRYSKLDAPRASDPGQTELFRSTARILARRARSKRRQEALQRVSQALSPPAQPPGPSSGENGRERRPCACGCVETFVPRTSTHRFVLRSHRIAAWEAAHPRVRRVTS